MSIGVTQNNILMISCSVCYTALPFNYTKYLGNEAGEIIMLKAQTAIKYTHRKSCYFTIYMNSQHAQLGPKMFIIFS